jgi:hypothetical protein
MNRLEQAEHERSYHGIFDFGVFAFSNAEIRLVPLRILACSHCKNPSCLRRLLLRDCFLRESRVFKSRVALRNGSGRAAGQSKAYS